MNDEDIDDIGFMLEEKGLTHEEIDEYFEHYGTKGMKWGVRREVSSSDRKAGRKEFASTGREARKLIKQARKSGSQAEREEVAKQYEKNVLKKIQTPAFKKAYQDANTMGKGEMAVQLLIGGPFAALTIPSTRAVYRQRQTYGHDQEVATAKAILREMRNID